MKKYYIEIHFANKFAPLLFIYDKDFVYNMSLSNFHTMFENWTIRSFEHENNKYMVNFSNVCYINSYIKTIESNETK